MSVFFLSCFLSFCGFAFSCYVMLLAQLDFWYICTCIDFSTAVSFLVYASRPPHSSPFFVSVLRIIYSIILQIMNSHIGFSSY